MVPSAAARLRHAGSILDPIRRVSHHQVRLDAAEDALDVRRDRAVAAEETMPPEQPQIARLRHRVLGSRRRVVGVRQPRGPLGQQILQLKIAEPGKRQIKAADPSAQDRKWTGPDDDA